MRAALGVSRSGFYAWLARPRRRRSVEDERLGSQVRQSFLASDRTYGARRVWHDLLALGERCGLHRVERLMRGQALRSRPRRRGLPKDTGERTGLAENILDRQFQADAPNQKWVTDFTYLWTTEGWLYVAAVLDLYSRRIVGWSMQSRTTSQLVADALVMAVWRRGRPQELLHHRLGRRSRRGRWQRGGVPRLAHLPFAIEQMHYPSDTDYKFPRSPWTCDSPGTCCQPHTANRPIGRGVAVS